MKTTLSINEIAMITNQLPKHVKRHVVALQSLSGIKPSDKVTSRIIHNLTVTYPTIYTQEVVSEIFDLFDKREQEVDKLTNVCPTNMTQEWLLEWAAKWEATDQANLELTKHYNDQAEVVDFAKTEICNPTKNGCTITDYANSIGMSKEDFYKTMQSVGVFKATIKYYPLRHYINCGYFSITEYYDKTFKRYQVKTLITEKGVAWLNKKIMKVA